MVHDRETPARGHDGSRQDHLSFADTGLLITHQIECSFKVSNYSLTFEYTPIRKSVSLSGLSLRLANSLFISINDLTVPYMTAYVDLEDPFLNHSTNGLTVYVISDPDMSFADSLSRDYDDKYYPIIKSFTIPDIPPTKPKTPRLFSWPWFKSYKPPLPPRFQRPFPYNIVRVYLCIPA